MGSELDKPLGGNLVRNAGRGAPQVPMRKRLGAGIGIAALIVTLAAGGTWVSLSATQLDTGGALITGTVPNAGIAGETKTAAAPGETIAEGAAPYGDVPQQTSVAVLDGRSGGTFEEFPDEIGNTVTKVTPAQRSVPGAVIISPADRRGQDARLAHLPEPDLIEPSDYGDLPVRSANGRRPFDAYARPWSGTRGARVTIIVGGLGLSQTGTQNAIRTLPPEVTLAFAANGNSLKRWMQEARRDGHEILLQVPFEPFDYPANDPGPGTLTVGAGTAANLASLHRAMAKLTNYTGLTNFMGGRFLADADALEPVMRDIADRGLMFVDDGTSAQSLTGQFATALGIPFAASDIVLDARQERGHILSQLDDLERIARRNGQATGVASAFDVSVDAIAAWAEEASARGIEIVAASAAAEDPERLAGR